MLVISELHVMKVEQINNQNKSKTKKPNVLLMSVVRRTT